MEVPTSQPVNLKRNNVVGSGPIQIDSDMTGVPYVLADQKGIAGIFVFKIVNKPQDALDAILEFDKKMASANHEHKNPVFSI